MVINGYETVRDTTRWTEERNPEWKVILAAPAASPCPVEPVRFGPVPTIKTTIVVLVRLDSNSHCCGGLDRGSRMLIYVGSMFARIQVE